MKNFLPFRPQRITELLDYTPEELVGESLYTLCHGEDAAKLRKCHMDCEFFHWKSFIWGGGLKKIFKNGIKKFKLKI